MKHLRSDAVLSLICYCLSSILMTLTNKYVLSELPFKMNFLMLTFQSLICVVMLSLFKYMGLVKFRGFAFPEAEIWMPVSIMLVLMVYTGSKSLQYLPIALFTIFKNLTIIIIAAGEAYLFSRKITGLMILSFFLMIGSSFLGGYTEIKFHAQGYFWMALNCLCSAGYALLMKLMITKVEFRDFDSVYYNNLLSTPILIFFSVVIEDWSAFRKNFFNDGPLVEYRNAVALGILFSSFCAFAISYCTSWAIRTTSSTTYSMVGALNKLPIAISGMIFIPSEKNVSLGNIFSVIMAFSAGLVYSYSQLQPKKSSEYTVLPTKESRQ